MPRKWVGLKKFLRHPHTCGVLGGRLRNFFKPVCFTNKNTTHKQTINGRTLDLTLDSKSIHVFI